MKLGKAFSDSLILERSTRTLLPKYTGPSWWLGSGRALLFATTLCLALFILLWRLFDLTIIHGHSYRVLADGNRTRELIRHAPRGILYDRTGKPLVQNIPRFRLITPCEGDFQKDCVLTLSNEEGKIRQAQGLPSGQFLEVDYSRNYLFGNSLSHIVGFTGELSEKELSDEYYTLRGYRAGDRVGRMGVEAVYEEKLRGRDGRELVEVDASGKIIRTLGVDREIPGEDVTLSFDSALSRVAQEAFPKEYSGAVVIIKPATGEILALYSSPSFSSRVFSEGLTQDEYNKLIDDPNQPLFNRAIGGVYPPGSTFKIVTAISVLEEGAMRGDTTIEDIGVIKIGVASFPNWYFTQYGKTEGSVDMVKAITRSNDIYFYKAGEALGITKLAKWAHTVGIGKTLGIEVPGEASGLMPDPSWKEAYFTSPSDREARNNLWYLGDTYHVAIGQGYLLTTPLQVNTWTNVIASGGKLCKPTIKKVSSIKYQVSSCKDLGIQKKTIELIAEGMKRACEPGGTGWPLFNFKVKSNTSQEQDKQEAIDSSLLTRPTFDSPAVSIPVACKTGTAEFGDPDNKTHAWFTVFAPLNSEVSRSKPQLASQGDPLQNQTISGEPEISITVLVEGAGEGSDVAAPVAKKILEEWFGR